MISFLCEGKTLAPFVFEGYCDTALFQAYLKNVLIPELPENKILIIDNASFHRVDKEIESMLENKNCKILYLPTYSPDLNPIEKFWSTLKTYVKKFTRNSSKAFINHIYKAFNYLSS